MRITYLIFTLLVFISLNSYSQTADFTYSTPNILFCSPQDVTFTANITGVPTGYIWDFGDGVSGNNRVQNHLYNFPGTYDVTLTVLFANSAASVKKSVIINPVPVITLNASRSLLCQPGIVNFTAGATGNISSYEWNFGDATPLQTTTNNTISHNFATYGSFNVTVKVNSTSGCSDTSGLIVDVARFPITATVTPVSGCIPVNTTISLSTTFPSDDGLQNIVWDFGDGSPTVSGSSPNIVHQYTTTNIINNANVNITSNMGCTNQLILPSYAYGIPPTNTNAYTTALKDTFCGSETIGFYGYADSANSYTWNFGDGTTMITSNTKITHKYSTLGNKQVTVIPFYNGCAGPSRTLNIYITGVIALYNYANTCSNKTTYNFTNKSLGNISSYLWTYSDMPGFIETMNFNPSHTFPASGNYVVKLALVDNATGCRDSLSSKIFTAQPNFISDKKDVCRDSAITYTIQNTYPVGVGYSYELHINGNLINLGGSTTYTYKPRNYGTYNDYVVIKDTISGTCNDTLNLGAVRVRGPFVSFTLPARICIDSAVSFKNNSYPYFANDNIVKWNWDFADGQKDSVKNPVPHLYKIPGQQIVVLQATDINGCTQQFKSAVRIAPLPSIQVLPATDTLCLGQSATLMAYTSDSLTWITTTNINCTSCDTVTVNPTVTSDYIARALTLNGCKNYDTATVKVFGPFNLTVTPALTTVCPGTPVQLNLNVAGPTTWTPSTFLSNSFIQNPVAIPDANVTYTAIVMDSVGCFSDSATASIQVYTMPIVDAGPDQFLPYNTGFTLSPVYGAGTKNYNWAPAGNLSCLSCPTPSGIALQEQQYVISILDANNCKAQDSVTIFVNCDKSNLLLPTAFTPNGDGLNETFYPVARGYKLIKNFAIFNRNGAKVFEQKDFQPNNPSLGWDGRTKGGKVENIQSYVWIIEGICENGMSIVSKGSVILIK